MAGASDRVLPNIPTDLIEAIIDWVATKSLELRHPHSPRVPSPTMPSSFPFRNTYSAPLILVPAYQGGYTMCASTAFSYRTHILGPISGTSDSLVNTEDSFANVISWLTHLRTLGFLPNLRSFGLGFSYNEENWDGVPDKTRAAFRSLPLGSRWHCWYRWRG